MVVRTGVSSLVITVVAVANISFASLSVADPRLGCFGRDPIGRVEACTKLLDQQLQPFTASMAYAQRGLAYALRGAHQLAIADYNKALKIDPHSAATLNNRAWVYFKSGRPAMGVDDVERSLELSPNSAHAHDTRAHIRQALGNKVGALEDYERAMKLGGSKLIRLYQCGLQSHGLFAGSLSGVYTPELRQALEECVERDKCDPLPPDEECRRLTS